MEEETEKTNKYNKTLPKITLSTSPLLSDSFHSISNKIKIEAPQSPKEKRRKHFKNIFLTKKHNSSDNILNEYDIPNIEKIKQNKTKNDDITPQLLTHSTLTTNWSELEQEITINSQGKLLNKEILQTGSRWSSYGNTSLSAEYARSLMNSHTQEIKDEGKEEKNEKNEKNEKQKNKEIEEEDNKLDNETIVNNITLETIRGLIENHKMATKRVSLKSQKRKPIPEEFFCKTDKEEIEEEEEDNNNNNNNNNILQYNKTYDNDYKQDNDNENKLSKINKKNQQYLTKSDIGSLRKRSYTMEDTIHNKGNRTLSKTEENYLEINQGTSKQLLKQKKDIDYSKLSIQKKDNINHGKKKKLSNIYEKLIKSKSSSSFHSNSDLIEIGRDILNEIRIETNPFLTFENFIKIIQKQSTLLNILHSSIHSHRDTYFANMFNKCKQKQQTYNTDNTDNTSCNNNTNTNDNDNCNDNDNDNDNDNLNDNNCVIYSTNGDIEYCDIFTIIYQLIVIADPHFISMFLLSYRSILSSDNLMELLIYRAFIDNGVDKLIIHDKILYFLCDWVKQCYLYDFSNDTHMLFMLSHFVNFLQCTPSTCSILLHNIGYWISQSRISIKTKRNNKQIKVCNLKNQNPTEIARQLALAEYDIFRSINPTEFAHLKWCNDDKEKNAPNILRMISQFNSISNWTASTILSKKTPKKRAILLNRFIIIAEESRALQNFNAVMAILSGLQSSPIYRLKQTWNLLPEISWDIWDNLNDLMSNNNNYANYRSNFKNANSPCIPYIGIFLTDLVFIEGIQDDKLKNTNLININKLRCIAGILFYFLTCSKNSYKITPIPILQAYLLSIDSMSEETQKQTSLILEPNVLI